MFRVYGLDRGFRAYGLGFLGFVLRVHVFDRASGLLLELAMDIVVEGARFRHRLLSCMVHLKPEEPNFLRTYIRKS